MIRQHRSAASSGSTKTSSGCAGVKPPEPILPPTRTLNPFRPCPSSAGTSAMSCESRWTQLSGQPVMVTLNLRGRLLNALLPTSWLVRRQSGQRAADDVPHVVHAGLPGVQAHSRQMVEDRRHIFYAEPPNLNLLPSRDVQLAAAKCAGHLCQRPQLGTRND